MLRIFLASSHLSAVLQAVYAKKSREEGFVDILIIDSYYKKETLITSIKKTRELHNWDHVLDFSEPIEDVVDIRPDLRKRILRKVKHLPLIRNIYKILLRRYERKTADSQKKKIIR